MPLNDELVELVVQNGRGERIRTSGPCLPKTVLYQAELLPDSLIGHDPDEGRRAP